MGLTRGRSLLNLAGVGLGLAVLVSACSATTTTGAGSTAPSTTALGTQSSSTTAATALEAAWQQMAGPLGAYKGHAAPILKVLTPGYQTFFIPTEFQFGSIEVQLTFDSRAKVAGLYLRPPGFDQAL
ncbi:MAG TPA: hypothetical protein VMU63_08965 [Acidimicrobiales bacterium]|nr:hypothetical protein [Acidimicrobiales bacterium]